MEITTNDPSMSKGSLIKLVALEVKDVNNSFEDREISLNLAYKTDIIFNYSVDHNYLFITLSRINNLFFKKKSSFSNSVEIRISHSSIVRIINIFKLYENN